jgi:hypothetical protein
MRLRPRRRTLIASSPSPGPVIRYGILRDTGPARTGQARRLARIGMLLTVIALRPRWQPVLAGTALMVLGFLERQGAGGLFIMPGLVFLWRAVLIPGDTDADHQRRCQLQRELAAFSTPAQRSDLEATLDRYPDGITAEMRDVLAAQAAASPGSGIPGVRRW